MIQEYAKVMSNHTICLPRSVRDALGIEVADRVAMSVSHGEAILRKTPRSWKAMAGLGKKAYARYGGGEAYLKKERAAWLKH